MTLYHEAIDVVQKTAASLRRELIECIQLTDSIDRVASASICSDLPLPPFDNSAMDGYAVRSSDLVHASASSPILLQVIGTIAAGDEPPTDPAGPLTTYAIMTGAPFPMDTSFDACVRIEDVVQLKGGIQFSRPVRYQQNRRLAGSDMQIGDQVLAQGETIRPEHVLAIASLGKIHVPVYRKLNVAIVSTGKEFVTVSTSSIRDSNGPYIAATLNSWGNINAIYHGAIGDEPQLFQERVHSLLNNDVIISTGGVSMGKFDFVPQSVLDLNGKILWHKVKIRPGHPMLLAKIEKTVFFGLPGNPLATVVCLRFVFQPYVWAITRRPADLPFDAILADTITKPSHLRVFYKAIVAFDKGTIKATILKGQQSFRVLPLLKANAWVCLEENQETFSKGTLVQVYSLHPGNSLTAHQHSPMAQSTSEAPLR